MFVRLVCGPDHELADGYTPAFCGGHAPEPASYEPRRPHLAIGFVREQLRRLNPGKDGSNDRLFDLPRLGKP